MDEKKVAALNALMAEALALTLFWEEKYKKMLYVSMSDKRAEKHFNAAKNYKEEYEHNLRNHKPYQKILNAR